MFFLEDRTSRRFVEYKKTAKTCATKSRKMTLGPSNIPRGRQHQFFCISILVLTLAGTLEAAPLESTKKLTASEASPGSRLPSGRSHSEEVGNPSELAWQAWLLVDGNPNSQNAGILDSATLLRRITPKSIFIAPALTACAEGYQADTMNRCVKDVSIDNQAHRGFLVERLNAIFGGIGKPQSSSSSSSSSVPTGPLQLNIPLFMPEVSKPIDEPPVLPAEVKKNSEDKKEDNPLPTVGKPKTSHEDYSNAEKNFHDDSIVTVYELEEATKDNESTFVIGNKGTVIIDGNSKSPSTKLHEDQATIPTDKTVPSSNENPGSNEGIGSIVDYKVPEATDEIFHPRNSTEIPNNKPEELDKEIEVSPTLVLLLTPKKLPAAPTGGDNELTVANNSRLGQVILKMGNMTGNLTGKEIIKLSMPESLGQASESDAMINKPENDGNLTTDPKDVKSGNASGEDKHGSAMIDEIYDRPYVTGEESTEIYDEDDVNYEESTEFDDEILKHSEAGTGITLMSNNEKTIPKPAALEFASVLNSSDKAQAGNSEISSEVSVNRDFVRETTLVDIKQSIARNDFPTTASSSGMEKKQEETTMTTMTTTTIIPEASKELEIPGAIIVSLDDLRNEKRDGHFSNVKGFVGNLGESQMVHGDFSEFPNNVRENKNSTINSSTDNDSGLDSTSKPNPKVNSTESENWKIHELANDKDDENLGETVYPVRGIEETFEDFVHGDLSSTEKADSAETMMAASTNVADAIVSRERPKFHQTSEKQGDRPFRFAEYSTTKFPPKEISSSPMFEGNYDYDIPPRGYPTNRKNSQAVRKEDPPPIIRTIDEDLYRPAVKYDLPTSENAENRFTGSQRNEDYVGFPNDEVRPKNRVRFPSDDANSISNDYKERNRRPYDNHEEEIYNRGQENTRVNLVPEMRGKEPHWWLPNEWRDDRHRSDNFSQRSKNTSVDQRSRDRSPMLLRFWTRMPLVRDPSMFDPTLPVPSEQLRPEVPTEAKSLLPSRGQFRRANFYRGITDHDITRAFARNKPAMGG